MSRTYLKHLGRNETYTLLSNFYHNKLNISRIFKEDKLFGLQYLQRIRVIANESIVTYLLYVLNMLIFLAATWVIKNNKLQGDTLTFLLVLFTHSSISFNRDEHICLRQYVFRVLKPFDVTVINCSSFCLKQIIQVSS